MSHIGELITNRNNTDLQYDEYLIPASNLLKTFIYLLQSWHWTIVIPRSLGRFTRTDSIKFRSIHSQLWFAWTVSIWDSLSITICRESRGIWLAKFKQRFIMSFCKSIKIIIFEFILSILNVLLFRVGLCWIRTHCTVQHFTSLVTYKLWQAINVLQILHNLFQLSTLFLLHIPFCFTPVHSNLSYYMMVCLRNIKHM